ncbi:MAG: BlaI/MecI/CopY family transcriptional regulator [Planctomycetes bacterium]|nr:BlaI/MecI/CopY family transcriptional regulator [Planctomycetota bacterium]MBL7037884.1 BlaI/MecI/CopY family transcriptional regulator [Pirellulaceae bacterium]
MAHTSQRRTYRLGDLQLKIMRVLWELERASVADVHAHLAADRLAYTTVATMLRKMDDRGLVRHDEEERRFIYEACVSESEVRRSSAEDFLDRVCDGSLASAVNHLLETRDVSREELAELQRLIKQHGRGQ